MTAAPGRTGQDTALPSRWGPRRARRLLRWLLVVLALGAASALLAGLTLRSGVPMDPENPDGEGTQALARVLTDQGVPVEVVRGARALDGMDLTGATLLVQRTDLLSPQSGAAVMDTARGADLLVLLQPGPETQDVLGLPVTSSPTRAGSPVAPECTAPLWREGDRLSGADTLVELTADVPGAGVCFPPSAGFNLGGARGGFVVELPEDETRPRTLALGMASALTNAAITEEANAAAGLRLLGGSERLVWLVPTASDLGADEPRSVTDVLPSAFLPGVAVLLAAVLTLALVRGRRLGPLVTEPLPAVIRSAETTRSRALLYQSAGDRRRALAILQTAARRRWAVRLGIPVTTPAPALVQAVAEATGRSVEELTPLLQDPGAPDDTTLVRTARALRSLDEGNDTR